MDISTLLEKVLIAGYATSEITVPTIFLCMICTAMIACYIYCIYKIINRNTFYNKNFNLSLIALSIITSAVILTIQSNIVVSLGMVGALSIVRFRTAIKDPLDLIFLFWSITAGIICGAGFALIAIVASLVLTIIILLFSFIPSEKGSLVLVVNSPSYDCEERVIQIVRKNCGYFKIRARNITEGNLNMAIEIKTKHEAQLIESLMESRSVLSVSLVEHDGDITA